MLGRGEEKKWRRLFPFLLLHNVTTQVTRGFVFWSVRTLGIVWQLGLRIQGLTNDSVALAFLKGLAANTLTAYQGCLCRCVAWLQYLAVSHGRIVIEVILLIVFHANPTLPSLDVMSSQFQPYARWPVHGSDCLLTALLVWLFGGERGCKQKTSPPTLASNDSENLLLSVLKTADLLISVAFF